jgi:hypothetical protein
VHIKFTSQYILSYFYMSVPNSIRYGNSSREGSGQPAPADKEQTDSYMQNAQNVASVQTEKSEHVA